MTERQPSRNTGIRDGGRGRVIDAFRHRKALCAQDHGSLGERTIGSAWPAKENTRPVVERAHAVRTAHDGKLSRTGEVSSGCKQFVYRFERSGHHRYQDFAVFRDWLRKIFDGGGLAEFAEYDGSHGG